MNIISVCLLFASETDMKNVKSCKAVSHTAIRDNSGRGWESEVKAIMSWVASLADL